MTLLPGCADGIVQQAETYHHARILPRRTSADMKCSDMWRVRGRWCHIVRENNLKAYRMIV